MEMMMTHDTHDDSMTRRAALQRALNGVLLISGGMALGACASSKPERVALPTTPWPDGTPRRGASTADIHWAEPQVTPTPSRPMPTTPQVKTIARAEWARGNPVPRLMDRMKPVNRITLHHDGMNAFTSTNRAAAARRIEAIRSAHRRQNWGDIGYHYVVDPAGRIWEARPLTWQGAHVRAQNEGNLGICVLGNYEVQRPNDRQIEAVERFILDRMQHYRVSASRIFTHRELAATACPGRNLQTSMIRLRHPGSPIAMA